MRRRSEDAPWYRQMLADRAARLLLHVAAMRRESPYAPAPGCEHRRTVERTCNRNPDSYDGPVVVRLRLFECLDCGVGVWPEHDGDRENAPRIPRCTFPACDCFAEVA